MKIARIILVVAFAAASLLQAAPNDEKEIQELYRRGLAGDKAAVDECIAKLEAVLQDETSNQLARVYLGSAYTLRSRDLAIGPGKLQALRHGLALMDEAVAAAPNDSRVRLPRALTTSALPGFLGRAGTGRKDFEWLARAAEAAPEKFTSGDLQVIFYNAGLAAKANGNRVHAATLFRDALKHPADPQLTAKLNAELSKVQ